MQKALCSCFGSPPPAWGFLHGVASFDPLPNGVLIWTRWTPPEAPGERSASAGRVVAEGAAAPPPAPPPGSRPADGGSCGGGAGEILWEVSERQDFRDLAARWGGEVQASVW